MEDIAQAVDPVYTYNQSNTTSQSPQRQRKRGSLNSSVSSIQGEATHTRTAAAAASPPCLGTNEAPAPGVAEALGIAEKALPLVVCAWSEDEGFTGEVPDDAPLPAPAALLESPGGVG